MRLGALLAPMPRDDAPPERLAEMSRTFEGEGYDSIWIPQAIGRGFMFTDPFVALAVAATATTHVELGTAVVHVPLYQRMDLAHRIFSLVQLAPTRFSLGVGAGSTEADFNAFGRDYGTRFRDFEAAMTELRALRDTGALGNADLFPWQATIGRPPFLLGTWGKSVATAARDYDGWIASATYRSTDEILAAHERYRAAGGKRAIVSTIQVAPDADLGELRERFAVYADAGIDDAVVLIQHGGPDAGEVRKLLD